MEENPKTWRDFPYQKALIILLSAVSSLFGLLILTYRNKEADFVERILNLRKMVDYRDSLITKKDDQMHNCLEEQNRYFKKQDSINREILNEPAKKLINELKK